MIKCMFMKKNNYLILIMLPLLYIFLGTRALGQEPDLSKLNNYKEKINAWLAYCEMLRINNSGLKNNFVLLQHAGHKGLTLLKDKDAENKSKFLFYIGIGDYYQVKFDSAQYYFYQCLYEGQKANSTEYILNACMALIPINFQLRQQDKVDSCKNILQSILDTTHNKKTLENGYYAMGSYYQQKAYYSTAQDYMLKSIELRQKEVDTTSSVKLKADYAIQCYTLSKQYQNTDLLDKGLAVLKDGLRFASVAPVVRTRYLSAFTEIYSLMGNIDSALHYESLLEENTKNSPVVPSEMVSANLDIATYYLNHQQPSKALPFVNKADTLATRSKSPMLIFQAQISSGRYHQQTGNLVQSISLFTQSLPVANQISKEQYTEELKYMAEAQEKSGNLQAALEYYKQYTEQKDSLTREKISRNFADLETRYETSQKEQRIVSLDKENRLNILELQNATRTRLLLVISLAALGIISLLLFLFYRNKEKVNKILNQQNDQLEALNGQLAVSNETKTKLFSIIGHDLRSPISQIVQLLQIQKERPDLLNEPSRSLHETRLKTASENVLETMEDLLLWSKSQMQHFTPQFAPVRILATVQKELNLLRQRIDDKNIQIINEIAEDLIHQTDENFLSIIVRNLIQNAVKYSFDASTIYLSANDQAIFISNQSSHANVELLNDLLQNKQVDSKISGLGLQIANDLATSIGTKIFFEQKNNTTITTTIRLSQPTQN